MDLEWRSAIQVTECDNLKFYVIRASLKNTLKKKILNLSFYYQNCYE